MRNTRLFIAVAASLVLAAPAFADAFPILTGDLYPVQPTDQIHLVREELLLTLPGNDFRVHATYTLHNAGPATTIDLGLLQHSGGDPIWGLTALIDGQPPFTPFRFTKDPPADDRDWYENEHWGHWAKTLSFEAGQTREVVVDYWVPFGSSSDMGVEGSYALSRAAGWAGPIETFECTVVGTADPSLFHYVVHAYTGYSPQFEDYGDDRSNVSDLPWQEVTATEWVWRAENFELDRDLVILPFWGFWNFTLNGAPIPLEAIIRNRVARNLPHLIDGEVVLEPYQINAFPWPSGLTGSEGSYSELKDDGVTLVIDGGPALRLPHGTMARTFWADDTEEYFTEHWIYLRDLIEAQGGTYSYDPVADRVDLTLPED